MKNLVIGEFCEAFPPLMDGVGNVVKNYSEELIERGHTVVAVVAGDKSGPDYDKEHGIDYTIRTVMHGVPGIKPYGIVSINRKLKNKVKQIKFDIIHTHSPFFLGKLAYKTAKRQGVPLVSTFHSQFKDDITEFVKWKWLANKVTTFVVNRYYWADEVWTPSGWSKKKLQEYGFKGEIRVVGNACDMEAPTQEEYEIKRKEGFEFLGINNSVPILTYIGQHKVVKNIPMILDSLRELDARGIDFQMVFVGEGPDRAQFEKYVKDNHLEHKIRFLGKIVDRERLKSILACSSLFLFPSLYDISSIVMREAAAYRLPMLYIKGATTAEYVVDYENGFLAENTVNGIADRVEEALGNPEILQKASAGARATLYRHWRDALDEVEMLYQDLIKRKAEAK